MGDILASKVEDEEIVWAYMGTCRRIALAKLFVTQLKYGAASSILILDYDVALNKFKVFKRVEVPRSEYTYDNAVNKIVELNEIYNPSFIYVDRGSGEIFAPLFRNK